MGTTYVSKSDLKTTLLQYLFFGKGLTVVEEPFQSGNWVYSMT